MKSSKLEKDLSFFEEVAAEKSFASVLKAQRLVVAYKGTRQGNAVLVITRPSPIGLKGRGDWDLWTDMVNSQYLNVHFEVRSRTELRLDCGFGSRASATKVYEELSKHNGLSLLRLKEKVYENIERRLSELMYQGRLRPVPVESRPKGPFERGGNQSILRYPYSGLSNDADKVQVGNFFAEVIGGITGDPDAVITEIKRDKLSTF